MAKSRFHEGPGPSQRQLRVAELIRRRLSDVLAQGDIHDPDLNRMSITVGEVSRPLFFVLLLVEPRKARAQDMAPVGTPAVDERAADRGP